MTAIGLWSNGVRAQTRLTIRTLGADQLAADTGIQLRQAPSEGVEDLGYAAAHFGKNTQRCLP